MNNHVEQHPAFPNPAYPAHSQSPPSAQGSERLSPVRAAHPLPHGYNHAQPTQNESHIHPELRSSHEPAPTQGYAPVPSMMPAGLSPTSDQSGAMSASTTTVVVPAMGGVDNSDGGADGRKAKRELSQSKRAAQNRAAQVSILMFCGFTPVQLIVLPCRASHRAAGNGHLGRLVMRSKCIMGVDR